MMDFKQQGIKYAVENIKQGEPVNWASGTEADRVCKSAGRDFFQAREAFFEGVEMVNGLHRDVQQAIRSGSFAAVDGVWSRGLVPSWLFPLIREMGSLAKTVATAGGDLIEGAHHNG